MKKYLLLTICSLIILLSVGVVTPTNAEAASHIEKAQLVSECINILDDGSFFHITITESLPETASCFSQSMLSTRSTQTKSGSKTVAYYNSDNEVVWEFTLYGTFQYIPGSSAGCVSSSYSINIYDSNWENTYASASKSGNQAIGDATFKEKILFVTTQARNVHVTLSCNAYGTLS